MRSATSTMYQIFFTESQRAPSALAASFSANGVTKLILMGPIILDSRQGDLDLLFDLGRHFG